MIEKELLELLIKNYVQNVITENRYNAGFNGVNFLPVKYNLKKYVFDKEVLTTTYTAEHDGEKDEIIIQIPIEHIKANSKEPCLLHQNV